MVSSNFLLAAIAVYVINVIPHSKAASIENRETAYWESSVEDNEFYVQFSPVSRDEAFKRCQSMDMHLAAITSQQKWESVKFWLLLNGFYWGYFWTSGVMELGASSWVWENSRQEVTEFQWAPFQPELINGDAERQCIGFTVELGGWYVFDCDHERLSFICER
ncbi:Hypothetical predicted protein [Cloeon dipterum]|uniref:C-type lectin domain-containing protein n=1 Tax=Cloeon dipterum TaxID=197152 RepID=A0A8S1DKZ1_9INSE|nr:Hypothetical predicted protein [Cloeon dipterum]